jgi:hypothetical protein
MNLCKASILLTGYLLLIGGNIEAQSTNSQKTEVQSTEASKAEVQYAKVHSTEVPGTETAGAETQNTEAQKEKLQDTVEQSERTRETEIKSIKAETTGTETQSTEAQGKKAQKTVVQDKKTQKAEVKETEAEVQSAVVEGKRAQKPEAQDTIIPGEAPEAKAQSIEDKVMQELRADPSARTRFITRSTMYGIGFSNVFDTYLSPQEYTGIDFRIARESMRMTRMAQGRLSLQNFFQADVSYTHNHVDNNNTIAGLMNWNYGLHYNFPITPNFKLLAGGLGDFNGGFVYNLRNNNNPASARAYINLDASGMAIWNLRIKTYPVTLRYQLNLPIMGVMFSPHYGQSYYEIFTLNNSGGVVQFTSLHNQPSLRQLLTLDFPVGQVKMRLAYIWDAQQSRVNGIKTHTYSHVFMVGFVKEIYLLRNKGKR